MHDHVTHLRDDFTAAASGGVGPRLNTCGAECGAQQPAIPEPSLSGSRSTQNARTPAKMLATAAWVGRKWGALSRAQASQAALAQVQTLAAELPREDQLAGLAASIEAAVAAETKAAKAKGADREAARVEADKVIGSAASVGPEVATLLADARAPLAGLQATLQTHPRQVVQGAARILDALLRASALSTAAHALSHTRPADARGYRPSIAEDEAVQLITDMFGVLVDAHFYAVVAAREAAEAAEASTSAPASNPGGDAVDQAAEHHAAFDPEHATPSSADQAMANYVLDALSHFPGTTHALLSLISPHRAVYTRLSSFRLFARMLHARGAAVRSHVLTAPGGCGEVVEHLILAISHGADASAPTEEEEDSNPLSNAVAPADVLIRAVTLTLLPSLVSGSAEIAKLVAFGGSFEALLDVIARAGRVEGGQLTYLALAAMLALLQGDAASSNGTYFRETGGIVLLPPLLFFPSAAAMADPQRLDAFAFQPWPETPRLRERKVNNVALVLSIADALTRPEADSTGTTAAALVSGGMVACVANIACASTAPTCVRTMALKTLAKLVENDHTRAALATGRGATLYMKDALYDTLVAPILPAPPEGAIRTPPRPVPAVLVDLALAGDPLSRTWAGENKFTEALPVLRAEAAAEASTADEADVLGMQRAHEQAELTARLADRPLRDAASQVIAAFVSTASAKQAVLHALLPPPIELVQPPEPPPADLPGPQGAEAMGAEATTRPQSPRPMAIISPERAKAELLAGPLLGALVGPPPHEILAENDFAVSAAATSAAALFADLLSPPAGAPLDAAVESVTKAKETALEVSFDLNGQVCIRPLLHTEELASETDGEYDLDSEDDDVDPREPLFQVVLARATRCLAHISAVPAAIVLDSPDASGRETAGLTAEGLLSLLSFWVWGCPAAASTFLRESENLHALLPWRKRLSAAQAAQATTGPMAGQARLAGVASFLLAAVYQFNTATHGLTRKTLQPLLASDPVTVEEASWLIRNLVVRPPTKSDVEGQNDSSALPLYAQRSFLQFYQQTHCKCGPVAA